MLAVAVGLVLVCVVLLLVAFEPAARLLRESVERRRPRIPAMKLRALTIELFERLGLGVVEEELHGDQRRLVFSRRPDEVLGVRYVVYVEPSPPGDRVALPLVADLARRVRGEKTAVGLIVTPYAVDEGVIVDPPVELVDGPRLRQLVAAYLPERLGELERYRGFLGAGTDLQASSA